MSKCKIFSKSLESDIIFNEYTDITTSKLRFLQDIIPGRQSMDYFTFKNMSGVWKPIVIKPSQANTDVGEYSVPLTQAGLGVVDNFSPCNCSDNQIPSVNNGLYAESIDVDLNCSYCGDIETAWNLYDTDGDSTGIFKAGCCGGACEIRMQADDFVPKIPILNQSYISGFYDFKHLKEFPAIADAALGKERFIESSNFSSIKNNGAKFCIDWTLKPTISEIDYDIISSQHLDEDTHYKSSLKSDMISKTCGNFILIDIPILASGYKQEYPNLFDTLGTASSIPSTGDFTKPYGFKDATYNNIFIDGRKLASHWRWNINSGIIGWYRYYDVDRKRLTGRDDRPIEGIDLYISQGDVFWAQNVGPEKSNHAYFDNPDELSNGIKLCPSGLKIVDKKELLGVVPSESSFVYISHNLYTTFYTLYEKYLEIGSDHEEALRLASIMCTAPLYDGYTVDLLHPDGRELFLNEYQQIDQLNKDLLTGTRYESADGLRYIHTKKDLFNNLYYKYGGYIWIPPNRKQTISVSTSSSKSVYIDIDFDMVVSNSDNNWVRAERNPVSSCKSIEATKKYYYNQKIKAGQLEIASFIDSKYSYDENCGGKDTNFAAYGHIAFNNNTFASVPVYSGIYRLTNIYPRITTSENLATSINCYDCGPSSSFYLVENAEKRLCDTGADEDTFCYGVLANFFNNSEGPGKPEGTRPLRTLKDSTLYWHRSYKALPFNPHIDSVAFHKIGGAFARSTLKQESATVFDRSIVSDNLFTQIDFTFETKNAGIKIYSFYAETLQSDTSTADCRRFPIDKNDCKCYGLNLRSERPNTCDNIVTSYTSSSFYVPLLSTKNVPKLSYYGGYTVDEVEDLFGIQVPQKAGVLPDITTKIDPSNPYSCAKSVTLNLTNYNTSTHTIALENFSTSHANIVASVDEVIDWTGPPIFYGEISGEDSDSPDRINADWKRFLNKVTVNGKTLYSKQSKIIYQNGSTIPRLLKVKVENPYLQAITSNGSEMTVKGNPCESTQTTGIFSGGRGDELSNISFTISQVPLHHTLNFKIGPPVEKNYLTFNKAGNFIPDKGLTKTVFPIEKSDFSYDSIDDLGRVRYDLAYDLFASTAKSSDPNDVLGLDAMDALIEPFRTTYWNKRRILYGDLNEFVRETLFKIGNYNIHRKPRVYIKYGAYWYQALMSNRGGYKLNNKTFIGSPHLFEYTRDEIEEKSGTDCVVPISRKQQLFLDNKKIDIRIETQIIDDYTIKIPGSMFYFAIPQTYKFEISAYYNIVDFISNVNPLAQSPFTMIKLKNNTYYFYLGVDAKDLNNYISVGTDPNALLVKNNTDIDYSNIAVDGYIYNTSVVVGQEPVLMYETLKPLSPVLSNEIINKKLEVEFYNKAGQRVDGDYEGERLIRIYTVLKLRRKNRYKYLYSSRSKYIEYDELESTDTDPLLNNALYRTKWGDLVEYNGAIVNNPYTTEYSDAMIPKNSYNNLFIKQILNDFNYDNKFLFASKIIGSTGVAFSEQTTPNPYMAILQKYNVDDMSTWSTDVQKYQNYVPVLQISLPGRGIDTNSYIPSGITSSNLFINYDEDILFPGYLQPTGQLIIDKLSDLKAAFVPENVWYSTTLRLDYPLFFLKNTTYSKPTAPSNARQTFFPTNKTIYTNTYRVPNHNHKEYERANAFWRTPVYADLDEPDDCGGPARCSMTQAGFAEMGSTWIAATGRKLKYETLPDKLTEKVFISYDAGLYNPIGDTRYVTIVRAEGVDLNAADVSCGVQQPIPAYNKEFLPYYQSAIANTINLPQDANVVALDAHANEMLFRILYGEKTSINKEQIFSNKKSLTQEDLIGFSEPEITPLALYDEIVYDYERKDALVSMSSTIVIYAKPDVGDAFSMTINGVNLSFSIYQNGDDIYVGGSLGDEAFDHKIYEKDYITKNLIQQKWRSYDPVPPAPESVGDNDSIELVSEKEYQGKGSAYVLPGVGYGGIETHSAYGGNGADVVIVLNRADPDIPCAQTTKDSDPYNFGYCRVNEEQGDCDSCEYCTGIEGPNIGINFTYEFEECATKYILYGHAYRKSCEVTTEDDPAPPDDTDSEGPENRTGPPYDKPGGWNPAGENCHPVSLVGYGCWPEACIGYTPLEELNCGGSCCGVGTNPPPYTVKAKVYIRTTVYPGEAYKAPNCKYAFATITYDNFGIKLDLPKAKASYDTYNGKVTQASSTVSVCKSWTRPLLNCANINVGYIPTTYSMTESITSNCEDTCDLTSPAATHSKDTAGATIDQVAVCPLGVFSHGNVQGGSVYFTQMSRRPSDGTDDFGRALPPCYGNGGMAGLNCDGSFPWHTCTNPKVLSIGLNHQNYWEYNGVGSSSVVQCDGYSLGMSARGPTHEQQAQIWKDEVTKGFNRSFYSEGGFSLSIGGYGGSSHNCQVAPEIPITDIYEGVIPGSCSLNFKTFTASQGRVKINPDSGVEIGGFTVTYIVAYLQYTYRTSKAPQDFLTSTAPGGDVVFAGPGEDYPGSPPRVYTSNSLGDCPFNEFPDSYKAYSNLGYLIEPNPTYVITSAVYATGPCASSSSCYNKHEKEQTVCNETDWQCWAEQHYATRAKFLSRIKEENWS